MIKKTAASVSRYLVFSRLAYFNSKVKLYGTSFCGPCNKAKKYLNDHKIPFDYVNVEEEPMMTKIEELKKEYNWPTIPMIFVNGQFVGGFSDFMEKVKAEQIKLEELK